VHAAPVGTDAVGDTKLKRATAEFEASLLASWLEKMRESYGLDDQESAMAGSDSMNALATQAVAKALAERDGLGIGRLMYEKLRAR
jgi:Rod binding domain-containing protein